MTVRPDPFRPPRELSDHHREEWPTMRRISVNASLHITEDARYDVRRQDATGAYVISVESGAGSTTGVDIYFQSRAEFDRFERAIAAGRDRFHDARDGLRNDPYGYDPDEADTDGPSAEQERAWNEQYDSTSLGG